MFYVALTRAKERALLSYTLSRYRWGKLIDAEPSRFIEEIDPQYVNHLKPKEDYNYKPFVNTSIFGSPSEIKLKTKINEKTISSPTPSQLKKLRKIEQNNSLESSYDIVSLKEGMNVEHARFGKGIIQSIEGKGNDSKAIIIFKGFGTKNLLLRFAKLKIE